MKEKVSSFIGNFRAHWKTPAKGRYMPYKEIASLATGGIGVRIIVYCVEKMLLSVGNVLIGNTIGIEPRQIYVIYIISILCSFPLTALRAKMIDSARSMKGKYRPYIITMGIPTAILGSLFMVMPYEKMDWMGKCITVLIFNIGFQFFYMFYVDTYNSLINVLSPNSIERSDVLSIKSIVENISPSIANIILPLLANLITGDNNLYDIKIYRILYPPFIMAGFAVSLLVYFNTEEKIVQSKTHVVQLKFVDAFRAIAKNKYFWIISLAGWLGFLESSFGNIIGWMYSYQNACSPAQYSLITAIAGNASFWPNLVAPFFIRRYGKKKVLVATNLLNIGFILIMYPVVRMVGNPGIIWFLLICIFANNFITSLGSLLNPSVQADIRDYQQYISGERIDGMFAAVSLIGSVITLATSSVLPTIYEKAGLNSTVAVSLGYSASNVYDVLYDKDYFIQISSVLVVASVVGAVLNVIPFFFYDLKESDQKGMVSVLKIRAMFEDLHDGTLRDGQKDEVREIIAEAKEYSVKTPVSIVKEMTREEKKLAREINEKILVAKRVMDELEYYESENGKEELERAKLFVENGLDGFENVALPSKSEAKAMPKSTAAEKNTRASMLNIISSVSAAAKAKAKYYPDGIEEFDTDVFEKLFEADDNNEKELAELLAEIKKLKTEKGDAGKINALKDEVKDLQRIRKEVKAEIKKATAQNSIYHRAAKPYLDSLRTVTRSEDYKNIGEILG